ncbi:hypothetical protein EDC01DRAFT_752086 [Geopyxis carbonaria]|nr:hypothetical protein EDC01DRAFT_752086 [Geopyxis carbonaria]
MMQSMKNAEEATKGGEEGEEGFGYEAELRPEIAAYNVRRAAMMEEERKMRHDYDFRQRLSPTAKAAAAIVSRIRAHEAEHVWKKVGEQEGDVFPGMSFTLAKERMEGTMLWRIVRRFPKGALLHAHLEAMVDMDWLLDRALETDGMCIRSPIPLTSWAALNTAAFEFEFSPVAAAATADAAAIYTAAYTPHTLLPLHHVAAAFPTPCAGVTLPTTPPTTTPATPAAAFRAWFKSRTTITAAESMKQHEGINLIWAKFQSVFGIIHGLVFYEPIFRRFVTEVLSNLLADNCHWADIRIAFLMTLRAAGTGAPLPRSDVVRIFGETVDDFKAAHPQFWGARIIWTTVRALSPAAIHASMQECIDAKLLYPAHLSGFDLVAQEDLGRSLHSHLPELLRFQHMCAAAGVHIPLFLHAGETLGDGTDTDNNLFDALLLGAKRLGHGFALYKHPHLMALARSKGVCCEVCPISNEILRLCGSVMQHPLPALLAQGVPVAVSNDDPGILGQMRTASLSHDYWQVLQGFGNVGLEGLGDLAETGVRFAAVEEREEREEREEKEEVGVVVEGGVREGRLEEWTGMWEGFCAWVVEEFGDWQPDVEAVVGGVDGSIPPKS